MAFHTCSISHHNRSDIAKWLGIVSVVLAPILATLLIEAAKQIGFLSPFIGRLPNLLNVTITAGLVYACLYWLFNRYVWRLLRKLLSLPDINGIWQIEGSSLAEDGSQKYQWTGQLTIVQRWDGIEICMGANNSSSLSYTALISELENGQIQLSYCYKNEPKVDQVELHRHSGHCEIEFEPSGLHAKGSYYTSRERKTFGTMKLTRGEDNV